MFFGEYGQGVGAYLVGYITVCGNSVRANHYRANFPLLHHGPGHVVRNNGRGNAIFHQFPRGQPRALQERTRLIRKNMELLA